MTDQELSQLYDTVVTKSRMLESSNLIDAAKRLVGVGILTKEEADAVIQYIKERIL